MTGQRQGRWLALYYALYFSALGAFMPYWGPYLQQQGLTALEIGILTATIQATKVLAPNIWGLMAVRWGLGRIVPGAALATALGFLALLWAHDFFSIFLITIAFSFFWAATLPLVDITTMEWAERSGAAYGRIRLWGSIGFILLALGMGWLIARGGMAVFLPVIVVFLLAAWWSSRYLPFAAGGTATAVPPAALRNELRGDLLFFFAACILEQASHGPYYAFYSIYVGDHGQSSMAVGLLWGFAVLCEVLFFAVGEGVIRRLGLKTVLYASFLLTALRWGVIGLWPDLPWIVAVQSLHAASYGAFHLAAVHWVYQRFPTSLRARGLALYASAAYGLGGAMGALAGGWAWQKLGGPETFYAAAALSLLGTVLLLAALRPGYANWERVKVSLEKARR